MTSIETTMYTLGQLARAVWPKGDMPATTLDTILSRPATGVAIVLKSLPARRADAEAIDALVAKLPADLSDPHGGVKIEDQGPFWIGWYHYLSALDRAKKWGPDQLIRAGSLLYGDRWQSDLARSLGVGDRRVREWVAGERSVPPGVWADIAALLRQRSNEGLALLAELDHR